MEPKLGFFINIYDDQGKPLVEKISSLRYAYNEEEDDNCEIELESDNRFLADLPQYREGKSFSVQWGWLNGSSSNIRKVYVFDRRTTYRSNAKIQLKLICHEKAAIGKMDSVTNKNLTQLKSDAPIMFSTNALSNIKLSIQKGNKELESFFSRVNLNSNKKTAQGNIIVSHYNGNMATYYTLRNFLDKLPGGPYVMDSRDDGLTIRTRDFAADPKKSFTWAGGTGELLDFEPETKNRSSKSEADSVTVATYDPLTKTAAKVTAKSEFPAATVRLSEDGKSMIISLPNLKGKIIANPKDRFIYKPPTGTVREGITYDAVFNKKDTYKIPKHLEPVKPDDTPDNIKGLLKIMKQNKDQIKNPYNDFDKKVVDKGLAVKQGNIAGSKVELQEIYLGSFNNRSQGNSALTARDNTAVVKNIGALVTSQKSLGKIQLSNEPKERAAAYAQNMQKEAELENNPGSAELIGQPEIESGQIITILGVGKIHSGNYYIKSCEHVLDDNGYSLTLGSLCRDGQSRNTVRVKKGKNIKLEDMIPNNPNLNKYSTIVNNKKGPEESNPTSKKIIKRRSPNNS